MPFPCDQCETMSINGVATHEIGCPDAHLDYPRECDWCGQEFLPDSPHQTCCDADCAAAYNL